MKTPLIRDALTSYFDRYPALLFGLLVTLGTGLAIYPLCWPFLMLLFCFEWPLILKGTVIVCTSFAYTSFFLVPNEETYDAGRVTLTDIRPCVTPFSHVLIGYGTFKSPHKTPVNCSLRLKKFPEGNVLHYENIKRFHSRISGTLKEVKKTPSPIFLRYRLKQIVLTYVKKHYSGLSSQFMQTIATGFSLSNILNEHFSRCGLSHILAVSGFHFSLVLGAFFFLLKRYFGPKKSALICAFIATILNLYYGESASVLRAYEMSLLVFLALIFGRTPSATNLFGIALICSLTLNPFSLTRLGFQLSYAATFGLLTLAPALLALSKSFLPNKPYLVMKDRPFFHKVRYLLAYTILSITLVSLSAALSTLPILLCWFHTYPIATLFYNLFMPPLFALALLLFFIGIFFPPLHVINNFFLSFILTPIIYQPRWTGAILALRLTPFSCCLLLFLIFSIAILNISKPLRIFEQN